MAIDDRITAEEARVLFGMNIDPFLREAYSAIRSNSEKGNYGVKLTGPFWANGGYEKTPQWKAIKSILENDGFTVDFFYEERQFVNMYTVVTWAEKKKPTPVKEDNTTSVSYDNTQDMINAATVSAVVSSSVTYTDTSSDCSSSYSGSFDSGSSSCDSSSF